MTGSVEQVTRVSDGFTGIRFDSSDIADGALFFQATSESFGNELYKVTESGSVVLASELQDGTRIDRPTDLTVIDDVLYLGLGAAGVGGEVFKIDASGK